MNVERDTFYKMMYSLLDDRQIAGYKMRVAEGDNTGLYHKWGSLSDNLIVYHAFTVRLKINLRVQTLNEYSTLSLYC